jgi:argininosuccinate lyase
VGQLVAYCIANQKTLETLSLAEYRSISEVFEDGVYAAIDMNTCVSNRKAYGGPCEESVLRQIQSLKAFMASYCE